MGTCVRVIQSIPTVYRLGLMTSAAGDTRARAQRREAAADGGATHQLAWKEGEVRLATSPARSGPHSTRPARGRRCPGSRHKATGALERYHIFLLVLSQPLTCCAVLHPYSLSVQCARSSGAMSSQRCLKRRAYDHQWLMQVAGS